MLSFVLKIKPMNLSDYLTTRNNLQMCTPMIRANVDRSYTCSLSSEVTAADTLLGDSGYKSLTATCSYKMSTPGRAKRPANPTASMDNQLITEDAK